MSFSTRLQDLGLATRYYLHKPFFLVIMGMHRSGTSCLARCLNLAGVDLGRDGSTDPDRRVLNGKWEATDLVWINDSILSLSGGSWDNPPEQIRWSVRHQWQARRFLWTYNQCPVAAIKDPRAVLTYPFWELILPPHAIIVCFRHPVNVALSLQAREGWDLEKGTSLWHAYNERLLQHIAGRSRVYWYDFENGLEATAGVLQRICHDFSLGRSEEALSNYNGSLHHHRLTSYRLPKRTHQLYETLLERAGSPLKISSRQG